ncbi:PREDICTED: TMV resistance protein N-like isoform X2 [Nelumbo nucifera]|uniref:TMV resistance protein N-like isoform X2 n=1 Tax=Nelumbo nucifera TaxID=4432 RepID=A0A1U8AL20_NELNU|nr:PREDICTED: TMV resistance protein N-like isoform X2 [Nelumbo nucifera]
MNSCETIPEGYSPPPPSSTPRWNYDVFLSFRGEDTRRSFIDPLYSALVDGRILAFKDDEKLRRGEEISSELLKAIEESKSSIVVFSRNYASSKWCLDELAKIVECKKTMGLLVLPVFYDVDQSDVREQTGTFAEAFVRHEERFKGTEMLDKVQKWKESLAEAADLPGWNLQDIADGNVSKFIQVIVEEFSKKLNFDVATYPVGIDLRVEEINSLLSIQSDDVRIVGICGMGGVGKTTIAKAVYNLISCRFEGGCFLANIREVLEQPNGLVHLQELLLSDILREERPRINEVGEGTKMIKERLFRKRVLIVLDDVDQKSQLIALVGSCNWFGLGSRIIVTTRNEHLLCEIEADEIYQVKELNSEESLQLLSRHAFRRNHPMEDYKELSSDVINYVGGLPLALEVQGSFLFEKGISEWKNSLKKLERIPHNQIQQKLRIVFDELDDVEKDIFLDIACFFNGMDKDSAITILGGCDFFPEIGTSFLLRRCLITINEKNELWMHDMLRDMGRQVVYEESPEEPGKRSRLWFYKDAYDVLTKNLGTEAIEGLILDLPRSRTLHLSVEAFSRMNKLRLLQLKNVHVTGSYEKFPQDLRWLCWHGFPSKFIPTNFNLDKLVSLDLQHSRIRQVWKEYKSLQNLKILNLSHCSHLVKTPNFWGLLNLEKLILEGCTSLVEVHSSIEDLDNLVYLNLKDCRKLRELPSSIYKLKALQDLVLPGSSKPDALQTEPWLSFFWSCVPRRKGVS